MPAIPVTVQCSLCDQRISSDAGTRVEAYRYFRASGWRMPPVSGRWRCPTHAQTPEGVGMQIRSSYVSCAMCAAQHTATAPTNHTAELLEGGWFRRQGIWHCPQHRQMGEEDNPALAQVEPPILPQQPAGRRFRGCRTLARVDNADGSLFAYVAGRDLADQRRNAALVAKAEELHHALIIASATLRLLCERAWDDDFWNERGAGYDALQQANGVLDAVRNQR
jgi:hypothetical protein